MDNINNKARIRMQRIGIVFSLIPSLLCGLFLYTLEKNEVSSVSDNSVISFFYSVLMGGNNQTVNDLPLSRSTVIALIAILLACGWIVAPFLVGITDCIKSVWSFAASGFKTWPAILNIAPGIITMYFALVIYLLLPVVFMLKAYLSIRKRRIRENVESSVREQQNANTNRIISEIRKVGDRVDSVGVSVKESEQSIHQLAESVYEADQHVQQVSAQVQQVDEKITDIGNYIRNELTDRIKREKSALLQELNNLKDPNEEQIIISELFERLSDTINKEVKKAIGELNVKNEEIHLKELFGDEWNKLQDFSRSSLISAGVVWESLSKSRGAEIDYSGVCICVTAALEAEIKKWFFTIFKEYEKKKYGVPKAFIGEWDEIAKKWPASLLHMRTYKDAKRASSNNNQREIRRLSGRKLELSDESFTMGSLQYIMIPKNNNEIRKEESEHAVAELEEYLKTILKVPGEKPLQIFLDDMQEGVSGFLKQCLRVKSDYRDKAAHAMSVSRKSAIECYVDVVGTPSGFTPVSREAALKTGMDVTALLYWLMVRLR